MLIRHIIKISSEPAILAGSGLYKVGIFMFKNFSQKVCIFLLFVIFSIFVLSISYLISVSQYAETLTIVSFYSDKDSTAWLAVDDRDDTIYTFIIYPDKTLHFSCHHRSFDFYKSYQFTNVPLLQGHPNLKSENFQKKIWVWCIKNLPDQPDEIFPIVKNPPSMGPAKHLSETLCDLAAEQLNLPYRWSGHRWITVK